VERGSVTAACGVLQYPASSSKPESISTVRGVDGTSRDNNPSTVVPDTFQVRSHSEEPTLANRCRNLLSHDDRGPAGTDEAMKVRPQMPWIICSGSFACLRERLARTGAGPEGPFVSPASKSSCNGPEATAGKEVALGVAAEVVGVDDLDRSGVDVAWHDDATSDEFTQDVCGSFVVLVVVGADIHAPSDIGFDSGCPAEGRPIILRPPQPRQ